MKKKSLLLVLMFTLYLPLVMWGQKSLPYEYGFENNDLATEGWTLNTCSSNTKILSSAKRTGSYGFRFYCTSLCSEQYLFSPELSTTNNGTVVEFYYKSSSSSAHTFQVGYSTTTNDLSAFTYGEDITTNGTQWTVFSQTFSAETKYIAIKYTSESTYTSLYLDDFNIEEYSEYPAPKNLVLTSYTSSSATLDWTGRSGQDHWDIYYSTNGNMIPDVNTIPQVSNTETKPYTISSLESGVTYYAYVRGNYNNGEHFSDWSNVSSFEVGCYTPTITDTQVTCNQAYIAWTPGGLETSWQVVISEQQGFNPDAATPETVTTQYKVFENLTTGMTYYARVRSVCGEGDYSDWSEEVSMTTECFSPSNLQESVVTPTTATLTWTQGSNESQWQISYSTTQNFTPENGTIVTVNSKPFTLTGLTVNTQYYASVRAICGENIYSDWSNICAFMPKYELTVGNGTNFSAYLPICTSAIGYTTKSQFIVPATDLTDLLYANISKMTFYASSETGNMGAATFDVLISELNGVTSFENSEFFDWSEMTSVYSGSLSVSGNKMEVILAAPYQYMGGNLLIGFMETASGSGGYFNWYGAGTTDYCSYGGYEMTAYSYTSYDRYKFMPKTTFSYTPGTAPTCIKPSNLNISQTSISATLTWTAGDDETHWNVQYKEASASEWSASIAIENTPTYTLNNLSPITNYQVRVQADCGGGDTSGWIAGSFTTACGPTNVPYSHNFDNDATGSSAAFPQCWTKINDAEDPSYADYPYIMGSNAHSGSNCLFFMRLYDYTALNQMAVLPEMNADVMTLQLSFYAKLGSGSNQPLSVGVMTDPEDASTFVKIEDVTVASTEYAQYTVSFDEYEGSGHYIALKCERVDVYNQIYVDDINVTTNNICFAPENPQISDVTANSAVFTWTPGSDVTSWQVQYKKTTDADWSESIAVNGTASYTFNSLLSATEYQARVRTDCGNDNYSDWVDADNFTTDCGFLTLPYSHDFDDDATGHVAPTCWHFSDGTYPYIYEGSSAHSSNHYLQIKKNTDYAATLVLPAIDTDENPINTLKLTFWARSSQSTYYYEYLYAGVMTDPDDMSTFQSVQGATTNLSTTTYKQFEFYFDNWTGEGNYIALRYGGSTTYYIDDIEVSVAPTCRQPLELSGNYSSAHEANIRWKTRDLRQCNYQVSYSTTESFDPEDGTIVDVEFENTLVNAGTDYRYYDLTCLNSNTTYYFYVRANCGNGDFSEWSDDYASFTTGVACQGPDYVMTDAKNTYVKFEWYGDIDDEWEFQYKESSSNEWITPTDFVVTPGYELYLNYTLHGLTPGVEYNARLRKHCGMCSCPEVDDGYSDWYELWFSTYDGCWDGDPWMCTSHLGTKATLRWLNSGPDMRWQIRYRLSTEYDYPEENIVTTDILPEASLQQYTLTGLEPNSTYYWQVRGYCDEDSQSDWSDEDYFFTRSTDGYITVDKTHPYYEDFENGMPENWSRMNLYNYDMEHYDAWQCVDIGSSSMELFPSSYCISSCRENMSWASDGSMVLMPAIHIDENATSATLSFWSKDAFNDNGARGTKMVWVNDNYLSTEYTAFDLGCVYQKSSKAGYWRKCFVNLDDYIGQTVIIAFDYVVTHNYNNYDWWVDNVCVEVFDNVFGSGSDVTEGSWDDPTMWGGNSKSRGIPTANDNVLINANVTIPQNFVAEANKVVLNLDTVAEVKYGRIIIADGGQLVTNNPVDATIEKPVTSWNSSTNSGWYAMASPVFNQKFENVEDLISDSYEHNIYRYDEPTHFWQEYRNTANEFDEFENGRGYLYRTMYEGNISYIGTINSGNVDIPITYSTSACNLQGFNLIGNPYPHNIYKGGDNAAIPNGDLLEDKYCVLGVNGNWMLTDDGSAITPGTAILVQAKAQGNLTIHDVTTGNSAKHPENNIWFTVSNNEFEDVACVEFKEGRGFNKMAHYNEDAPMLYINYNGEDFASVDMNENVHLIDLCFKAKTMGQYTLKLNVNGDFSYLHLVDRLTGNDVDMLVENEYSFIGTANDNANRFIVKLNANGDSSDDNFIYQNGDDIVVSGEGDLQVFDIMGRMIASQRVNGVETMRKPDQTGVYIYKMNEKTQKIVVR